MKKYIVEYELPYVHRVQVGIEAESRDAARKKAEQLFNAGDIWDDTEEFPLLYDDYDEVGNDNTPDFVPIKSLSSDDPWPTRAVCVSILRRHEAAMKAARRLATCFQTGGSVDRPELKDAYEMALIAVGAATSNERDDNVEDTHEDGPGPR